MTILFCRINLHPFLCIHHHHHHVLHNNNSFSHMKKWHPVFTFFFVLFSLWSFIKWNKEKKSTGFDYNNKKKVHLIMYMWMMGGSKSEEKMSILNKQLCVIVSYIMLDIINIKKNDQQIKNVYALKRKSHITSNGKMTHTYTNFFSSKLKFC